jgi:phage-related protein
MYLNKYNVLEPLLEVHFYRSSSGVEPVRDWLCALPKAVRKIIGSDIKTVQFGWPLGMPVVRKLERGLWEVRSSFPDGIGRVLFTVTDEGRVLLHGFVKKSMKISANDLETARRRLREVQNG